MKLEVNNNSFIQPVSMKYLSSVVSVIRSFPMFAQTVQDSRPTRNDVSTTYGLQLSMHMIELERRQAERRCEVEVLVVDEWYEED